MESSTFYGKDELNTLPPPTPVSALPQTPMHVTQVQFTITKGTLKLDSTATENRGLTPSMYDTVQSIGKISMTQSAKKNLENKQETSQVRNFDHLRRRLHLSQALHNMYQVDPTEQYQNDHLAKEIELPDEDSLSSLESLSSPFKKLQPSQQASKMSGFFNRNSVLQNLLSREQPHQGQQDRNFFRPQQQKQSRKHSRMNNNNQRISRNGADKSNESVMQILSYSKEGGNSLMSKFKSPILMSQDRLQSYSKTYLKEIDNNFVFKPLQSQVEKSKYQAKESNIRSSQYKMPSIKNDSIETIGDVQTSKYLQMPSVQSMITNFSQNYTMTTQQTKIERCIKDLNPQKADEQEEQRIRQSQRHKNAVERLKNYQMLQKVSSMKNGFPSYSKRESERANVKTSQPIDIGQSIDSDLLELELKIQQKKMSRRQIMEKIKSTNQEPYQMKLLKVFSPTSSDNNVYFDKLLKKVELPPEKNFEDIILNRSRERYEHVQARVVSGPVYTKEFIQDMLHEQKRFERSRQLQELRHQSSIFNQQVYQQ